MDELLKSLVTDGIKEAISDLKWDIAETTAESTINRLQEHKRKRDELDVREKELLKRERTFDTKEEEQRQKDFELRREEQKCLKKLKMCEELISQKEIVDKYFQQAKAQALWLQENYPGSE